MARCVTEPRAHPLNNQQTNKHFQDPICYILLWRQRREKIQNFGLEPQNRKDVIFMGKDIGWNFYLFKDSMMTFEIVSSIFKVSSLATKHLNQIRDQSIKYRTFVT